MTPKRKQDEASFEGLLDLSSVPPPASSGPVDVHQASTAVAKLPQGLLDELKRLRTPDGEGDFKAEESPTTPKDRATAPGSAPPDLLAEVNAALIAAGAGKLSTPMPAEPDPFLQVTRAVPVFRLPEEAGERATQPSPEPAPAPAPRPRKRPWRAMAFVLLALVLGLAGGLLARRSLRHR